MAVPAPCISIELFFLAKACFMTRVSSQLDTLVIGIESSHRAFMTSALLLILLDAGSWIVAFDFCVAVVWSKDFVIHLFAVGFVAKLAKKEEWYVSFLYLPMKYFSQISLFNIFCFCSLFYFLSHGGEGRIVALLP